MGSILSTRKHNPYFTASYHVFQSFIFGNELETKVPWISPDEGGIQCCLGNGADMLPPELQNDKCIPICVPDDDPFYRYYGIRCLTFVRSVTTPREDCRLGHAEQVRYCNCLCVEVEET